MGLEIRVIEDQDYYFIEKWLKKWNQQIMSKGFYPETGLILYDDVTNEAVYCGYVWVTNSKAFPIGCVTRNPFYKSKLINKQTRKNFIHALLSYASDLGCDYVMSWAENEFLKQDFRDLGLAETSNKCSEFKGIIINK